MTGLRFSAVVGQPQAKLALLLVAARPVLGGVLLRGDKGSAKTTLARGLAALLPGEAPFVELPLGATEERVIGSLDLAELLTNGRPQLRPGLLAAAHGGVLYVDEINLLADHLVDALLDVAVSGVNRVERDGMSHTHAARFVLVASMNPEEGELRPQLLDRFGLAVDISAPTDPVERSTVVRRQLAIDDDGDVTDGEFVVADDGLRRQIATARTVTPELPDEVVGVATRLAVEVGAEGLRADLMLCRAAAGVAALDGRGDVAVEDVRTVAEMVLAHRRRRRPFDEPGIAPEELDQAWEAAAVPPPDAGDVDDPAGPGGSDSEQHDEAAARRSMALPGGSRRARSGTAAGGFGTNDAPRGRYLRERSYEADEPGTVDAGATAVALATRRATDGAAASVQAGDLRRADHEQRVGTLIVFVVDASASMGVEHRMAATKAAVLGLLGDAYRRRGQVAMITFRGEDAEVVLRPTASVEIARARLADVRTGGATPLAAGLDAATKVVERIGRDLVVDSTVVLVTDGRATVGEPEPVAAATTAMQRLIATRARVVVLDTETGMPRLGVARHLAESAAVEWFSLDTRDEPTLEDLVRTL